MPTDPSDIARRKILQPKIVRASAEIKDRVEDAREHAGRAMTRGVLNASEGRETWRTLANQRSAQAAVKRLTALEAWLVGTTDASTTGFIQDSRAAFYKAAFGFWRKRLPAKIRNDAALPTSAGRRQARGLILYGISARKEIAPAFLTARNTLATAMAAVALPSLADGRRHEILDMWASNTIASLQRKAAEMLSDSQVAITTLVGTAVVKRKG